jgi:hypothetical protein
MSKGSKFIPQEDMRNSLHHLQERRSDNSYVYMFSENQATAMMPRFFLPPFSYFFSISAAPKGLDVRMFLNLMYRVHCETQLPAQKVIEAFDMHEGHYGVHPGQVVVQGKSAKGGCSLM